MFTNIGTATLLSSFLMHSPIELVSLPGSSLHHIRNKSKLDTVKELEIVEDRNNSKLEK